MAVSTARRLSAQTLELRGPALDTVMQIAASPYDLHHPHHQASSEVFAPAREYVKTLGHLARAYLDPEAWVRDAAFELTIGSLIVEAENPLPLDSLELLIDRLYPQAAAPAYMFHYQHTDTEGLPIFDAATLVGVGGERAAAMLETDTSSAGRGILARHKPAIDSAFSDYLSERIDEALAVREVRYDINLLGFSYDTVALAHLHQRSADELAEAVVPRRRTSGFLSVVFGDSRVLLAPFTPLAPDPAGSGSPPARGHPPAEILDLSAEGWAVQDELPARYATLELDRRTLLDELEEDQPPESEEYDGLEAFRPPDAPDAAPAEAPPTVGVEDFLDALLTANDAPAPKKAAVPAANTDDASTSGQVGRKTQDERDPLDFLDET